MLIKGCEITSQQTTDFATLRSGLSTCGIRLPSWRETTGENHSIVQKGCEIISQQKGDFTTLCKILPSAWSDRLAMGVTPSFQLRIVYCLKHWIIDFLSFETTYRMHKLNSRKCSKSGWHDCHLEYFMLDFSLLPLLAFRICLWQRTSKLRFFMFLSFPLLYHGFQITLFNLRLLWWSKSYQNTKT